MPFEKIIAQKIEELEKKIEKANKEKNYLNANIFRMMIEMLNEILEESKK